jgi:hypothetical protein
MKGVVEKGATVPKGPPPFILLPRRGATDPWFGLPSGMYRRLDRDGTCRLVSRKGGLYIQRDRMVAFIMSTAKETPVKPKPVSPPPPPPSPPPPSPPPEPKRPRVSEVRRTAAEAKLLRHEEERRRAIELERMADHALCRVAAEDAGRLAASLAALCTVMRVSYGGPAERLVSRAAALAGQARRDLGRAYREMGMGNREPEKFTPSSP